MLWNISDLFMYDGFDYIGSYLPTIFYNFFNILILIFIVLISLDKLKSNNLLPIVIAAPAVTFLILAIGLFISYDFSNPFSFPGWVYYLLYTLNTILLGIYLLLGDCKASNASPSKYGGNTATTASQTGFAGNTSATTNQNSAVSMHEGQESIVLLIVLSIITFGIYAFIWIYKTSKFINERSGKVQFSAGAEVALCLFVPFYILYWYYKQSKNVYEMSLRANINNGDLSIPNLILGLFGFSIVAIALIQNQINKLYFPQPSYPGQQPSYAGRQGQPQQNIRQTPTANTRQYQNMNGAAAENPNAQGNAEFAKNIEYIKQLKELLDNGIITEEEFETKKRKLLGL